MVKVISAGIRHIPPMIILINCKREYDQTLSLRSAFGRIDYSDNKNRIAVIRSAGFSPRLPVSFIE
jgi:hypothetical protein